MMEASKDSTYEMKAFKRFVKSLADSVEMYSRIGTNVTKNDWFRKVQLNKNTKKDLNYVL